MRKNISITITVALLAFGSLAGLANAGGGVVIKDAQAAAELAAAGDIVAPGLFNGEVWPAGDSRAAAEALVNAGDEVAPGLLGDS